MDAIISLTTLHSIAAAKLVLTVGLLMAAIACRHRTRPLAYSLIATGAVAISYCLLSWPLQRMFWGNNGDEAFIGAALTRVIHGGFFQDFYYSWLPPFYPPLYFWTVGLAGRLLNVEALAAAKLGVAATLAAWGVLPYLLASRFWRGRASNEDVAARSPWLWAVAPLVFLCVLDFDAVILKPYEILPALLVAFWIGHLTVALREPRWSWRTYAWFGVTGGLLFLTYYFWWFMTIPAMLALALTPGAWRRGLARFAGVGTVMFVVAAPYVVPLAWSLFTYGLESWQAVYFVPADLSTSLPWAEFSLRGLISLGGLVALVVWRRRPFMRGLGLTLAMCYGYQLVNMAAFAFGGTPAQMAKPFLFLGTSVLAVAASYGLVEAFGWLRQRRESHVAPAAAVLALAMLALSPLVRFVDKTPIMAQLDQDYVASASKEIAGEVAHNVPDYAARTWISSGIPDLNLYLPITYFIAHNPHFSHPAAAYSRRLAYLETMLNSGSPENFTRLADAAEPPVTALLMYRDKATGTFPIFLWEDAYPNGGRERRLDLMPGLIEEAAWRKAWDNGGWVAYVRK